MLSIIDRKTIVEILVKNVKPTFIYLYGSYARGEEREDSDIDLGVYADSRLTPYDLFVLAGEISLYVNRDVQIVDLRKIDTVFAAQIVASREVLYCLDEYLMHTYDMTVYREYAKLNEERHVVMDAIFKDGKIYG